MLVHFQFSSSILVYIPRSFKAYIVVLLSDIPNINMEQVVSGMAGKFEFLVLEWKFIG